MASDRSHASRRLLESFDRYLYSLGNQALAGGVHSAGVRTRQTTQNMQQSMLLLLCALLLAAATSATPAPLPKSAAVWKQLLLSRLRPSRAAAS